MKRCLVVMFALAGCGKGGSRSPPSAPVDVAAVNSLVPAALKTTLVFEQRDVTTQIRDDKVTYTLAVPRGWAQEGTMYAKLVGTSAQQRIRVTSSCGAQDCGKDNDWAAIADRELFADLVTNHKVVKDEKSAGRRTVISTVDDNETTRVTVAWWHAGGRNYHACLATLDKALAGAEAAFERSCSQLADSLRDD